VKEELDLLGLFPDSKVGRLIGCHGETVGLKRRELRIETWQPKEPVEWTKEMKALLGTMTDGEVAERLLVSHLQVRHARYRFGIAGWPSGRRRTTR
jgi:hypothetical protein